MKKFVVAFVATLLLLGSVVLADVLDPWDAGPDVPRVCAFYLDGNPLSNYVEMSGANSDMFSEIGYVPEYKHLYVRFTPSKSNPNGSVYLYTNVTVEYWKAFISAPSLGTYFNETIKGNFPCFRVYE